MTPGELVAKFGVLKQGSKNAIKRGVTDATHYVEGVAKDYCTPGRSPYDWMVFPTKVDRQGNLRSGAPFDIGDLRSSVTSRVSVGSRWVEGVIGSDLDYARPVHEGHTVAYTSSTESAIAKYGGGTVRVVPARPFVLDAILDSHDEIVDLIEMPLREAIGEVITRSG
jgi:hypothetical protein